MRLPGPCRHGALGCRVQERRGALRLQHNEARFTIRRRDLIRWEYLARLTLVTGILAGALFVWGQAERAQTFWATTLFLASLLLTAPSFWHTHVRQREPGDNFVYAQVIFDAVLVTAIVHITGGTVSPFAFLYILVISGGALLLPLPGGVLVGALATILFFGEVVLLEAAELTGGVMLQIGLFATVAVITGWLGDRVRRAGLALGAVQSELRQLRLDTSDILANIATGVLTVDGEGNLVYANPAAESMLGLNAAQWLGAHVLDALETVAPGLGALLRHSVEGGRPVARSRVVSRRGEEEVVLGVSTTVLDREEGVPPSVTAIFQDITELERLEALNRRNERLEAVAELSASLAHEIKNPLASIRSAVEQLSRSGLAREDRLTLERLVVTESDRLSRLLSDFLEFSALRKGRTREVDVSTLVRDCVALVRQHPEVPEDVEIECSGLEQRAVVEGDVDLLHRAVFNLLLNGAQFAGSGGRVCVSLEMVEEGRAALPGGGGAHGFVRLRVRDSGPGIAPDERQRIFDPFYTARPGGSGLGLALVHRAVEAHGGSIDVDRAPEGGAEFVLLLPAAPSSSAVGSGDS